MKMNTNITRVQSVNRQEVLTYLLLAAIGIFILLVAGLLFWTVSPLATVSPEVLIGKTADFPPAVEPYLIRLELNEKEIEAHTEINANFLPSIWLVHTETGWLALNRYTPSFGFSKTRTCLYAWVAANGRFEDPCYGSKFTLDGLLINPPATQNLTTYPVIIEGDEIWVDLSQPKPGGTADPLCRLDDSCL
jgi:hypothetical protein